MSEPLTRRCGLPLLQPAQAQKHVTVNDALMRVDGLLNLVLQSTAMAAPPAQVTDGMCYGVPAEGAGAWAGQGGRIAIGANGGWVFTAPEARGRGLTALTLGRIAERAAAAGFRRLGLRVGSGNDAARRCYLRAGFRPVGAPFLNERGLPEIEMHRPLPAPAASARRSA